MADVTVHFRDIKHVILSRIERSKSSIKIAMAFFADEEIFELLCERSSSGIEVELILQEDDNNFLNSKINYNTFLQSGGRLHLCLENESVRLLHHKFCVIDQNITITGSYNWTIRAQKNHENIVSIEDVKTATDFLEEFESLKQSVCVEKKYNKERATFTLGVPELDSTFTLSNGHLLSIVGASGSGKTALAISVIKHLAVKNSHRILFCTEDNVEYVVDRLYCNSAEVSMDEFRRGKLTVEEKSKVEDVRILLQSAKIFTYEIRRHVDMLKEIKSQKIKNNIDVVVIDYLQLFKYSDEFLRGEMAETVLKSLRKTAKDLNVPIVVLSQTTRTERRPVIYDLENERLYSNFILSLYAPNQYGIYEDAIGNSLANKVIVDFSISGAPFSNTFTLNFVKEMGLVKSQFFVASEENSATSNLHDPLKGKSLFNDDDIPF